MKKIFHPPLFLFLAAFVVALGLFEVTARLFVKPSKECYGTLWGRDLPPYKIPIPKPQPRAVSSRTFLNLGNGKPLIVNGQQITRGDLCGISRDDRLLGYAPKENSASDNRWWQTNDLGAHRRSNLARERTPGKKRILAFGESFAQASRVRQEESWSFFIEERNGAGLEVVNFGVDGYSMAQSFLRYQVLRDKIEHDIVLLLFVPSHDLWRDVNMWRKLRGWAVLNLTPRFEISSSQELLLVGSPYKDRKAFFLANQRGVSDGLRSFLREHDRFYFPEKYETKPVVGGLIVYKLLAKMRADAKLKDLNGGLMVPRNEALNVTRRIFLTMNQEVRRTGAQFILIFLPDKGDVVRYRGDPRYKKKWESMVRFAGASGLLSVDLMPEFLTIPAKDFDAGYDGSHFGAKTNLWLARFIEKRLKGLGII